MKHSEAELQQSIVKVLEIHGWLCFEYAKPGARRGIKRILELLRSFGVPPGVLQEILALIGSIGGIVPVGHSDLLALKPGKALFLEVKLPGKKATAVQEEFGAMVKEAGARWRVVQSIEDVLVLLDNLGEHIQVEVR